LKTKARQLFLKKVNKQNFCSKWSV